MIYINYYENEAPNYTFDTLFNNTVIITEPTKRIKTLKIEQLDEQYKLKLIRNYNIENKITKLKAIIDALAPQDTTDLSNNYNIFKIPKHSGGLRTISAPTGNLKTLLETSYNILMKEYKPILPHNCAYAYIENRDAYTALKQHQSSEWFLKLDIKDFFPSCNKALLMEKIPKTFPFNIIQEKIPEHFEKLIDCCLLENELPQGTNMSPMLTNTLMMDFDTKFSAFCTNQGMTYTRYADDILVSSKEKFNFIYVQNVAINMFKELGYNFTIKKEKTRFGSIKGANWNLGLMLNSNHEITIGYKRKKLFKAMINNFICENLLTQTPAWAIIDVQHLLGLYSYYHRIEPAYIEHILKQFNDKYNVNVLKALKTFN